MSITAQDSLGKSKVVATPPTSGVDETLVVMKTSLKRKEMYDLAVKLTVLLTLLLMATLALILLKKKMRC